jgi:uncharacterized protein (DUF697 family)
MMRKTIQQFASMQLKKTFMSDGNGNGKNDRTKHADTVIRNHVIWSMGASFLIPIPIADIFAVSALQLDMIRQLCRVYDNDFSETQGKAIVTSLTSSTLARAGARSLIKLVPGLGTVIGGVTVSVFNGASTYALGEVFKRHFESGGTILDFDTERLKKLYREKFEKGKKVAEQWRAEEKSAQETGATTTTDAPSETVQKAAAETGKEAVMAKLKELAGMRDQGILTEEEFKAMKEKLIQDF